MSEPKPSPSDNYCTHCGGLDGRIQHVYIAWPNGRHVEAWLHPECEAAFVERLERPRAAIRRELTNDGDTQ